jgi:hypothetical protein
MSRRYVIAGSRDDLAAVREALAAHEIAVDVVAERDLRAVIEARAPVEPETTLSPVAASLLLMGAAMGARVPRLVGFDSADFVRACSRCRGSRWATRDADGRAVPGHRCPACRRRS